MRANAVLWFLCCFLLSGPIFGNSNRQSLEVGMPRAEIIEILGEPSGRGSDGRREILFYGVDQEVHLQDGKVYLVTGAEGVIQERAQPVAVEPQFDAPLVATETVRIWTESSFLGPSFSVYLDEDAPPWALPAIMIFFVAVMVFLITQMWCLFVKAGWPGWTCLVPIYNAYVMLKIAGKPGWWLMLMMVPFLNIVVAVIIPFAVAERFGKGIGFGIGLLLVPWLFYAILAFGSSEYQPL